MPSTSPNQQDIFIFYAREGILNELKELIDRVDINAEDTCNNTTALIEATKHDHAKVVQYLCQYVSSSSQKPNAQNQMKTLLNHETQSHEIALIEAAKNNAVNIAKILLKYGADVNVRTTNDGITPLHEACRHVHAPMVKVLLEANADVTSLDAQGRTPLQLVPEESAPEMAALMENVTTGSLRDDDAMIDLEEEEITSSQKRAAGGKRRQRGAAANGGTAKQTAAAATTTAAASNAGRRKGNAKSTRGRGAARSKRNQNASFEYEIEDEDEMMRDEMQIEDMEEADTQKLTTPVRSSRRTSTASNAFNSTTTARTAVKATKTTTARKHLQRLSREKPKCFQRIATRKLSDEAKEYYSKLTDTFMAFSQTEDEELREELTNMLYSEPFMNLYEEITQSTQQGVVQES